MTRTRIAGIGALAVLAAAVTGCLISETDEYSIRLNDDGKSGTMVMVNRNIQSDQTDPAKQREDFDEMIRHWRGDQYLLEKTEQGVYVKERSLKEEKGVLVWREVSIFSDIRRMFHDVVKNDTLRLVLGKDEALLSTNGDVEQMQDSTVVTWPMAMKRFDLKVQKKDFHATKDFAARFRAYLKKK